MAPALPAPSLSIDHVRRAHVVTDRGARFAEIVGRVTAREAARDPETGLLPSDVKRTRRVWPQTRA